MTSGAGVTLALYAYGSYLGLTRKGYDQGIGPPSSGFGAYYLLGLEPAVWGLLASLVAGVVVSLLTPPPDPKRVSLLFDTQPPDAPAPATLDLHPDIAS
jgi:SSS family solute:Na+ symporter/sodium/pantothenate symporter